MDIKKLQDFISKKEVAISKIEKRIAKWEAAKSDKAFIKQYDWCQRDTGWWNRSSGQYDLPYSTFKQLNWDEYVADCDKEIRYANRDLADAKIQLDKYKNALAIADEKNRAPKIQIIVDFLNNWKEDAKSYIRDNMSCLIKYYEADRESCDFHNNRWQFLKTMSDEEYKAKYKELNAKVKQLGSMIHPWTKECYDRYADNKVDESRLQELVDKEAEAKYWDMIERITEKAGEIVDISGLTIGGKGDLNGLVKGTKNKVHLETIVAQGQCPGEIVNVKRSPFAHYRTICNVVK